MRSTDRNTLRSWTGGLASTPASIRRFAGLCGLAVAILMGMLWAQVAWASAREGRAVEEIANTAPINEEILFNGSFSDFEQSWGFVQSGAGLVATVDSGDPARGRVLQIRNPGNQPGDNLAFVVQTIIPPSQIVTGTLAFEYRVVQTGISEDVLDIVASFVERDPNGFLQLLPGAEVFRVFGEPGTFVPTDWDRQSFNLSGATIVSLEQAIADNRRIELFLAAEGVNSAYSAEIDNVSLRMSGVRPVISDAQGELAYIGFERLTGGAHSPYIARMKPDGTGHQIIWQYPDPDAGSLAGTRSVAWSPDATQLAFNSGQELLFSGFQQDIFVMAPDGSQIRKVTHAPGKAAIDVTNPPRGNVLVTVINSYPPHQTLDDAVALTLSIEGGSEPQSVNLPATIGFGQSAQILLENVADLGALTSQSIYFIWNSNQCRQSRFTPPGGTVDVVANQTVEITVMFDGSGCGSLLETGSLSWRADGERIGFVVDQMPRTAQSAGDRIGAPIDGLDVANHLAFAPLDNRIVFSSNVSNGRLAILNTDGTIRELLNVQNDIYDPIWMPDGNAILFTSSGNLYRFNLVSVAETNEDEVEQLTFFYNDDMRRPTVSSDGKYVAVGHNGLIAVMELGSPYTLRYLRIGARPDWSRTTPTVPDPTDPDPTDPDPTDPDPTDPDPTDPDPTDPDPTDPDPNPDAGRQLFIPSAKR